MNNTIKNNQELYSKHVLRSTEKNLEDIKNISSSVAYNQAVQRYLVETEAGAKFNLYQQVINFLNNTKVINNSILDIAIIGETGNVANLIGDVALYQSLYQSISDNVVSSIKFLDKSVLIIDDTFYDCQIAVIPIYNLSNVSSDFIGVLFVTINPSTILGDNFADDSFVPTELIFVNSNQQLILGNEHLFQEIHKSEPQTDIFNITYDNQIYLGQQFKVKIADGTLYTLVNQSIYTQKIEDMLLHQFFLIIMIFIITIIFLSTFVKRITGSFHQLTDIMNKISTGKRKAMQDRITLDVKKQPCLEVYSIANSFNDMMDEITRLNRDVFKSYTKMYELEMSKRKAEIANLRSQINPHFLYNTLTLICGMASENNTDGIIDITSALSRIYRYSIGNDIVSVKQELEIIESYTMIQMTRFDNRFIVNYDIAQDVQDALIPRMIIQPLVENAVKHGLEKCLRKASLTIGGRRNYSDDTLVLWIYDTGVGMTQERLHYVRQSLQDSPYAPESDSLKHIDFQPDSNIGLYNVNSRINLYYGDPYRLHIDSEEDVGTNVQIKIPFNTKASSPMSSDITNFDSMHNNEI